MKFVDAMERTLGDEFNYSMTENGALGYRTTKSALLDINYQVSSLRNKSEDEIIDLFMKAFYEDRVLAIKWLFYLRDVRGGLGERRSFRVILNYLSTTYPDLVIRLLPIIAEYGRWDDILQLVDPDVVVSKEVIDAVVTTVSMTLGHDMAAMMANKPCSLLAKWMPSANSKTPKVRRAGQFWARTLSDKDSNSKSAEKAYRKMLSALRSYIDVVECKMTTNRWDEINYESVPSKANINYRDAFMRHDPERRSIFLAKVNSGEAKINSSVAYPHEIVCSYTSRASYFNHGIRTLDPTLEAMWRNLPDTINGEGDNILVVRDGSGSMDWAEIKGTSATPLHIATALAIYFSERISGQFKDQFITFSSRPKLVNLSGINDLHGKLIKTYAEDDCSNTDIEAVFNLILTTAIKYEMKQEDMPSSILIMSDMEFDASSHHFDERLFESIARDYSRAGYKLPRLIFWNLCSRTNTIPIMENDMGVILISGFSVNLAKMVMSNETDPYKALVQVLESDRYKAVGELLQD